LTYSDTRRSTVFLDLDTWPPSPLVIDTEYVISFDVLPDGRLVVCSMLTQPESEYAIRIHAPDWPANPTTGGTEVIPCPVPGGLFEVHVIGSRVIAFDYLIKRDQSPQMKRAYGLKAGRFHPVSELPEVRTFDRGQFGHQTYDNGKVSLADGAEVLVWDGNGYELKRGRLERTWELAAKTSMGLGRWSAAPWGEDGFFYLSDRRVMYAPRGAGPVSVLPDAENVMYLAPGPERSVMTSQGRNRKSLAARVWFPADGSYIPVTRKDLGIAPHFSPDELYWSAATRHVYTKFGSLLTFPDSDLLAMKRVRPRGAGYTVPPT
jgi:hypothetical protein